MIDVEDYYRSMEDLSLEDMEPHCRTCGISLTRYEIKGQTCWDCQDDESYVDLGLTPGDFDDVTDEEYEAACWLDWFRTESPINYDGLDIS